MLDKDPTCIFCKIVAGEIPCAKVYEDDAVLSFLDIGPLAEGHVLVIPKDHYARLENMSGDAVAAVARCLPTLGAALMEVTGSVAYNVLQNNGQASGQEVAHVHFHLIPRVSGDGLGYRWNSGVYPEGKLASLQQAFVQVVDR